jgi:hypothetical protein
MVVICWQWHAGRVPRRGPARMPSATRHDVKVPGEARTKAEKYFEMASRDTACLFWAVLRLAPHSVRNCSACRCTGAAGPRSRCMVRKKTSRSHVRRLDSSNALECSCAGCARTHARTNVRHAPCTCCKHLSKCSRPGQRRYDCCEGGPPRNGCGGGCCMAGGGIGRGRMSCGVIPPRP